MTAQGFTTAVPGVTHANVFALDEINAGIVRVRLRGVYQLHAAVKSYVGCEQREDIEVLVNGTVTSRSTFSLGGLHGPTFRGPLIVFDILQLDTNDAITVKTPKRYNDHLDNRLNLVLLQRL
jgi:hypothetical protein